MDDNLKRIVLDLYDIGCFKDYRSSPDGNGFQLAAHRTNPDLPLSPFYLNLRTPENPKPGPLTPEILHRMGLVMYGFTAALGIPYDCFVGLPNAGTPFADAFEGAQPLDHPLKEKLMLEKRNDEKGFKVELHGDYLRGQRILPIDDLAATTVSKVWALDLLRERFHATVTDCVVFLDRRPIWLRHEKPKGLHIQGVVTIEEMLALYLEEKRIDLEALVRINSYLEQR